MKARNRALHAGIFCVFVVLGGLITLGIQHLLRSPSASDLQSEPAEGPVLRPGFPTPPPAEALGLAPLPHAPGSELSAAQQRSDHIRGLVQQLRTELGSSIDQARVQVTLKDLLTELEADYPGEGLSILAEILETAFPQLAALILERVQLMQTYDAWLLATLLDLNDLDPITRHNRLWDKRREIFGDLAAEIWSEDLDAEAERVANLKRASELLDHSYQSTMDERAWLFRSAFEENYAQTASGMVFDSTAVMTQVFFGFDAVQEELQAMDPESRQQEINRIRRLMGYPEDRIAELAMQDQARDADWARGHRYMAQRRDLENRYQGARLDQEITALQQATFGQDALTIAREESDLGFYRYQRERTFGRN